MSSSKHPLSLAQPRLQDMRACSLHQAHTTPAATPLHVQYSFIFLSFSFYRTFLSTSTLKWRATPHCFLLASLWARSSAKKMTSRQEPAVPNSVGQGHPQGRGQRQSVPCSGPLRSARRRQVPIRLTCQSHTAFIMELSANFLLNLKHQFRHF